MSIQPANMPKYPTVLNGGVAVLGTGASTVGATAINIDGIAADAKVVYTAGAYGGIVNCLTVSTNDTAAVNVIIYVLNGAVVHHYTVVNIPIAAGTSATGAVPNVDILAAIVGLPSDATLKKYIQLMPNAVVKVAVIAAMTANKLLIAKATGLDFVA